LIKEPSRRLRGSILLALVPLVFSGCSLLPRFNAKLPGNRAFIA